MTTPYLSLTKAEVEARLHSSQVRQAAIKRLPTILAEQLLLRLHGLQVSLPSYRDVVVSWRNRIARGCLSQDLQVLERVQAEYIGLLISKGLEEHWYKPDEAGLDVVRKHMDGLGSALLRQRPTSSGEPS